MDTGIFDDAGDVLDDKVGDVFEDFGDVFSGDTNVPAPLGPPPPPNQRLCRERLRAGNFLRGGLRGRSGEEGSAGTPAPWSSPRRLRVASPSESGRRSNTCSAVETVTGVTISRAWGLHLGGAGVVAELELSGLWLGARPLSNTETLSGGGEGLLLGTTFPMRKGSASSSHCDSFASHCVRTERRGGGGESESQRTLDALASALVVLSTGRRTPIAESGSFMAMLY